MPRNPKKKKKAQAQPPAEAAPKKDVPEKQPEALLTKIQSLLPTRGSAEFAGNIKTIVNNEIHPAGSRLSSLPREVAKRLDELGFDPYDGSAKLRLLEDAQKRLQEEEVKQHRPASSWHSLGTMHGNSQCSCIGTINQLLDELYACKKPGLLPRILVQIKKVCKQCTLNNAFITVYQKIKAHINLMRQSLYNRLWELDIFQKLSHTNFHLLYKYHRPERRSRSDELFSHYSNTFDDPYCSGLKEPSCFCDSDLISVVQHCGKVSRNYVCLPYEEAPEKYAKFLAYVCRFYHELSSPNIELLEDLCKQLLKPNQPTPDSTQYNIHKSLFERRILKDRIIHKIIRNTKRKVPKDNKPANLLLRKLVDEVNNIESEIITYRIQIRISKIVIKNPEDSGENEECSSQSCDYDENSESDYGSCTPGSSADSMLGFENDAVMETVSAGEADDRDFSADEIDFSYNKEKETSTQVTEKEIAESAKSGPSNKNKSKKRRKKKKKQAAAGSAHTALADEAKMADNNVNAEEQKQDNKKKRRKRRKKNKQGALPAGDRSDEPSTTATLNTEVAVEELCLANEDSEEGDMSLEVMVAKSGLQQVHWAPGDRLTAAQRLVPNVQKEALDRVRVLLAETCGRIDELLRQKS